jgi:AGCS family alanine or glycine:cation symporter
MLSTIESVNNVVNNFIWGVPAMICIIGVGLLLSVRTGFIQIRKFPYAMKVTIGRMLRKKDATDGAMTPFQAVCTALAATVGTGNIAGVAGAIAIGGPGAVFWMWISALLGMCTKFSEVTLAVHFREKNAEGDLVGGPMYYIKNGLNKNWHWLAYLFAAFGVLTVFGTGNATQVNTITTAIDSALFNYGVIGVDAAKTVNLVIGIVLAVLIALILLGGIKRIGQVTEKLVPFMAVIYVLLAAGVVLLNLKNIPHVFVSIFEGAFTPTSVTGGAVGSFFISMKKGVSRGIFSNEAGLGTGSIAHACADTKKPVKQGFFGIFEVFIDTIVICTLTALVILCSGVPIGYGEAAGAELTILGFTSTYGSWVSIFTAVAMCCFAFSTIIGWGLYGTRCIEFLFGTKINKPFMVLYSLVAIVGATMDLGLMWNIAETFNGLMAIPNLIAVFLLSGVVVKLVKEYFAEKEFMTTPMKKEVDRCVLAFEEAKKGKTVSMICSGDAGVYGMAGLMYEVGENYPDVELNIIPGVTAATGGAAVLGAPLIHDFCLISLSDLLTPWEKIEARLLAAAQADFVVCLYNPSSRKRKDYLQKACDLMMKYKSPDTVCGTVAQIAREGETAQVMTLRELRDTEVDMFTTVFVGNSQTKNIDGKMVTPRGYKNV